MKCREYNVYSVLCQGCDITDNIKCCKKFDLDTPVKYIRVERKDNIRTSWNECPICGNSIGYHPKNNEFRCSECNQRISWE